MTSPKVMWCDYDGFKKPTKHKPLHEAEAAANAAVQHPAFSKYLVMKIHDPIHRSGDQREHATVRLQSQEQVNSATYETGHIYVDEDHLYCDEFQIFEGEKNEQSTK